jgi:hypothetical protein
MTRGVLHVFRVGALAASLTVASLVQAEAAAAGPGAGASGGGGAGGGNGGPPPPSAVYSEGEQGHGVKALSRSAQAQIGQCAQDDQLCVADALDAYAAALRNLSPPLPPQLRSLPEIVSRAAKRVRQAKTKTQATAAIKIAIAEVHKTISLLKADDPIIIKAETRQGAFVAETLAVAEDKLEKASGL